MIDHLLCNWKTSLVGMLVLLMGFSLVYLGKASLTEFTTYLVASITLLFARDPKTPAAPTAG